MLTNRSGFIKNSIMLLDFIVVNAVIWIYYSHHLTMDRDIFFLMLCADGALLVGQFFFSTVLHGHYMAIDRVLRQVSLLSLTFALLFIALLESGKYLFHDLAPDTGVALWGLLWTVLALIGSRMVEYVLIKQIRHLGRNSRSLLFVGDAKTIEDAYNDIDIFSYPGLRVLGYYSDDTISEDSKVKMTHLGTLDDLKAELDKDPKRYADDIYCTDIPADRNFITLLVDYSIRNGIQFNYVPPYLNDFGYCLKPRTEGELIVFSNLNEPLLSLGNRLIKRTFDIIVSGTAIICIAPFIPVIGAIIKISSPGPIFFKQKRTGLNGEDFYMLKFRSMHVNKDADKLQATKDDPRKFAFGSFMRKTNIDELPQFINVFRGDMSIVGPRPHMLAHTDEYRKKIYEYMLRHLVRPGITGWAQVTGFRGETPELWQMEGRVQKDLWYIQNWSFWLDIRIIFRTAVLTIVHDKNAF